jgi:hypothetical protein
LEGIAVLFATGLSIFLLSYVVGYLGSKGQISEYPDLPREGPIVLMGRAMFLVGLILMLLGIVRCVL